MHPTIMDIEEIRRYLPHRYPFLLIDRIIPRVIFAGKTRHKCDARKLQL